MKTTHLLLSAVLTAIPLFVADAEEAAPAAAPRQTLSEGQQWELDIGLLSCVRERNIEGVKKSLAAGADPDCKSHYHDIPLHTAVDYVWISEGDDNEKAPPSPELVRLLLDAGATPDERNLGEATPLMLAMDSACCSDPDPALECARLLLQAGADVNARDTSGKTPLMYAVGGGSYARKDDIPLEGVRMLLDAGADIQARDKGNQSALGLVANRKNRSAVLRMLLDAGPSGYDVVYALQRAANMGDMDMLKMLLDAAKFTPGSPLAADLLRRAARSGSLEWLQWMLENGGVDINAANERGITALMEAASTRDLRAVTYLVEHGADVNAVGECGETALYRSFKGQGRYTNNNRKYLVLKYLLAHGADPNAYKNATIKLKDGQLPVRETPPHFPVVTPEALSLLLEHGADLTVLVRYKDALFALNADNDLRDDMDFRKYVRLLLKAGMDPLTKDADSGQSLLHRAAFHGDAGIIPQLLAAGVELDTRDIRCGMTPLMLAASESNPEVVRAFLAAGADVHQTDHTLRSVLMLAAQGGNVDATRQILDAGADIHAKDACGMTPLMLAATKGHDKVVALLLSAGADIEARDAEGRTALMHAARNNQASTAKLLLESGADAGLKDHYGKTAAQNINPILGGDAIKEALNYQPEEE